MWRMGLWAENPYSLVRKLIFYERVIQSQILNTTVMITSVIYLNINQKFLAIDVFIVENVVKKV